MKMAKTIAELLKDHRMHICTAMSTGYAAKRATAWNNADATANAILSAVDEMLAATQAQIIAAKNDEIARLTAELSRCQSHDYAGDLCNDCEAGLMLAAGMGA